MRAVICDKCKTVITSREKMKSTMRLEVCNDFVGKYDEKHLCEQCKKEFFKWFEGMGFRNG